MSPSSTLINITPFGETANLLMFFRFSNGKVHDLLLHVREKNTVKVCACVCVCLCVRGNGYFLRSKCESRFPTGLMTLSPSSVKTRLPWRYTAPYKLENWGAEWSRHSSKANIPRTYLVSKLGHGETVDSSK